MLSIDLRTANISNLPDELMLNHQDHGLINLIFADNKTVDLPARSVILNLIFWDPNYQFGILPETTDYREIRSMTTDEVRNIQTALYEKAIVALPQVPHMRIVMAYLYNVDKLSNFTQRYLGNYMPSIDALALARVLSHPSIQAIVGKPIPDNLGTNVAEQVLKQSAKQLVNTLREIPIDQNCLYPYMRARTLKANQIPQFLHGYGTRSDIDNTMMNHVITNSSFGGLRSVQDFAVEYLAGKKAIFFSHNVIRDSQYFARKLRLSCSAIQHIYPGSCGSPGWIVYTIPSKFRRNYIDRIVVEEDGTRVVLTQSNIDKYLDHPVRLVSQFACRHTDGICEHCAGYGRDRLIRYMPPDIHIGIVAEFMLASLISQQILSTKHLIMGVTMVYVLSQAAQQYLTKCDNSLKWNENMRDKLKELSLRIPRKYMHELSDLNCKTMPNLESFSTIAHFELYKHGELVDRVDLNSGAFIPYFSREMLNFMKQHLSSIVVDKNYIEIPLAEFNYDDQVMNFTSINDDLGAYVKQITHFLAKSIQDYRSIPTLLTDFTTMLYKKESVSINSFFIETVLRAQMITDHNNYDLPVVTDPFNVRFGTISDVISNRTVTSKFAFERMIDYIRKPDTPLLDKPAGLFGPQFGFIEN